LTYLQYEYDACFYDTYLDRIRPFRFDAGGKQRDGLFFWQKSKDGDQGMSVELNVDLFGRFPKWLLGEILPEGTLTSMNK
jgi:hypothetical protein